jgi:murein L,D-transpeptidase YafK
MDFNKNGFVELTEVFSAIDIAKKEIHKDNKVCIEYYLLKDGITVSDRCIKLPKADLVIVKKSERILCLIKDKKIFRKYKISLGDNPKGHKTKEGDEKTPEGNYTLDYKKSNSSFYKAIHISYPKKEDVNNAKKSGINPGGFIMIHGQKNHLGWLSFLTQKYDWTNGCIAVTNKEMDEIWQSIDIPIKIQILP